MWRGSNILNNDPHFAINPMRNVPDSAIQFLSRTSNNNLFLGGFGIFSILRKSHSFPLRLHLWIAWPRWGSLPSACHPKRPPRRAKTNGPRWDHTVWSSPAPARIGSDFVPPKPRGPNSQQRSWWRKTLWLLTYGKWPMYRWFMMIYSNEKLRDDRRVTSISLVFAVSKNCVHQKTQSKPTQVVYSCRFLYILQRVNHSS